ncbi:MAG: phosphate acyltransferase PlsX [Pseudomonadota bacterium]
MSGETIISVDAMGGDKGPAPIIAGLARSARKDPSLQFLLHGDDEQLAKLLRRRRVLRERVDVRHTTNVVPMDIKPSRALRTGRDSSMWKALQSVADGEAKIAFSAGNTGAIVALAMLVLRRAPGVQRPAIAVHWPAENAEGHNVVLDMGADIRADADTLLQYSIMGAEYSRLAMGLAKPRVGLLNIGSEDMKGRQDLREAKDLLEGFVTEGNAGFEFLGFVEGNDITTDSVDVIVTDGFTGNIAMKASEGTAALIRKAMKDAFTHSILSRFGALFALGSFNRLRKRIDPRRVNGGVFLGLNGGVVKSHGGADALGHSSAIHLAAKMALDDFPARVAARLANLNSRSASQAHEATSGAGEA